MNTKSGWVEPIGDTNKTSPMRKISADTLTLVHGPWRSRSSWFASLIELKVGYYAEKFQRSDSTGRTRSSPCLGFGGL